MKNKIITAVVTTSFFAPIFVYAQSTVETRAVSLTTTLGVIIGKLVPIAFALGVLYFFYGMAKYIGNAGNEDAKEQGKQIMIYGLLAMFVMVSVFGIIKLAGNFIGISNNDAISPGTISVPTVNGLGQ